MARLFDDAASEYLETSQAVVTAAPFTVSAWVYPDDVTTELTIFCLGDSAVHGEYWKMVVRGNVAPDPITFQAGASRANTSTGVTINTWHHACGIEYAANSRAAFIDGGSKGTNAVSQTPTPDRTAIGRECDSTPGFYFSGRGAEIGLWNVALSDDEVKILAAGFSPLFVRPQSLVAYWPLVRDEDQDRVGGYDLTAYNTPGIATHPPVIYPTPALLALAAAGGITYYEAPTGTFTSSGALARLTAATKAGAFTSSGAILRQTATSKAGTFTSSGSLARQAQKVLAGVISSAGALVRQGQKAVAGTLSSAGGVVKQKATTLAGTLTTSGALSTIRTFLRTVTGTLSTSGTLARQTGKSVVGSLTSAGAVIKRTAKTLAGALSLSGALETVKSAAVAVVSIGPIIRAAMEGLGIRAGETVTGEIRGAESAPPELRSGEEI